MKDEWLEKSLKDYYFSGEVPESFEKGWRKAVQGEERRPMKGKNWSRILLKAGIPAAAALVLVVGAISVSNFQTGSTRVSGEIPAVKTAAAYRSTGEELDGAVMMDYEVAEEAAALSGSVDGTQLWGDTGTESSQERKLVRTATLTLRSSAFEEDLSAVKALVTSLGGYLESFSQTGDTASGSLRRACLTIRIPAEQLDAFLGGAGEIGRVTERYESASDQTSIYYDNETRLATLRAKLTRLTEMMAEATDMSDIIEIEDAISETQYQIDSYETSQRTIDNSVSMSTVTLTLREEKQEEVAQDEQITLGERIGAAFSAGFRSVGTFGENLLVFLAISLPYLMLIALIGTAGVLLFRSRRKKKARKEEKE